jgi:hypothetical protein
LKSQVLPSAGRETEFVKRAAQETRADRVAILTRAYLLDALHENLEITLGRRKRTMVRFVKGTRTITREGEAEPVTIEVLEAEDYQVFDPNPTAANQAAAVLLREIAPVNPSHEEGPIDDRQDIRKLFAQFNAQEEARQRERDKERRRDGR